MPPTKADPLNGFILAGSLKVLKDKTGKFVTDFTGRIGSQMEDGQARCGCEAPNFGFK